MSAKLAKTEEFVGILRKRTSKVNEWVRCKFCHRLNLYFGKAFECNRCGKLNKRAGQPRSRR